MCSRINVLLIGAEVFTGYHLQNKVKSLGYEVFAFRADSTVEDSVFNKVQTVNSHHIRNLGEISVVTYIDRHVFYRVNVFGT